MIPWFFQLIQRVSLYPSNLSKKGKFHVTSLYDNFFSRYLDTGNGRDLFFYFFESRSSPKDDPVIMYVSPIRLAKPTLHLLIRFAAADEKKKKPYLPDPQVDKRWTRLFFLPRPHDGTRTLHNLRPNSYQWNQTKSLFME